MLIGQDQSGKTSLKKIFERRKNHLTQTLHFTWQEKKTEIIIFCYLFDVFNNKPSLLNSIMF